LAFFASSFSLVSKPQTRYRVMLVRDGRPVVICQPLTATQAQTFVAGAKIEGYYIERMPDHIRPGVMAH